MPHSRFLLSPIRLRPFAIGCLAVGTLTSASRAQGSPHSPHASLIAADRAVSDGVLHLGIANGLTDALAANVVLLYEGAPIIAGRERVHQLLSAQTGLTRLKIHRLLTIVAVSEDGNFGVTSGANLIAREGQPADSALRHGHYIRVWLRSSDDPWKMIALIENGLADPDSLTLPAGLAGEPPPSAITGLARAFAAADEAFARMGADSGGPISFGAFAAPDATTLPGEGDIIVGASAIRARMLSRPSAQAVWAWQPVYAGSAAGGDLGFTVGVATIRGPQAPPGSAYHGKYLTIWRRQADGTLKFILDTGNARPAK